MVRLDSRHFSRVSILIPCRHLTADGLARCEAQCVQKNLKPTAKNVEKAALDVSGRLAVLLQRRPMESLSSRS